MSPLSNETPRVYVCLCDCNCATPSRTATVLEDAVLVAVDFCADGEKVHGIEVIAPPVSIEVDGEQVWHPGVTLVGGQRIRNVHSPEACEDGPCCVHHPSDHHMVSWTQRWRSSDRSMVRVCPHGIEHPDPDHTRYALTRQETLADAFMSVVLHACDGCCTPNFRRILPTATE